MQQKKEEEKKDATGSLSWHYVKSPEQTLMLSGPGGRRCGETVCQKEHGGMTVRCINKMAAGNGPRDLLSSSRQTKASKCYQ